MYTHARAKTQCHGNDGPLPEFIPLSHRRKGDGLQVLMREALAHYSGCSDFRLGMSYSGALLKDPWFSTAEARREL